jgi:hypothetical protein
MEWQSWSKLLQIIGIARLLTSAMRFSKAGGNMAELGPLAGSSTASSTFPSRERDEFRQSL